jgi:hypothetical protein
LKRLKILLPVVLVLLLAAALRILGAGSYPVWTDEGWSAWATADPAQVLGIVAADRHPPLYFAALSVWRQAAGDSHLALRCLAIAGGLLTVAIVYRMGVDVFGRRAGVFAALFFAALPAGVYYTQEVRHYGWLALFTALSWLLLLRWMRRPSAALWLAYVLSAAALLYTLYFGAFTLAAQGVAALVAFVGSGYKRIEPVAHSRENLSEGRSIERPYKPTSDRHKPTSHTDSSKGWSWRWLALAGAWVAAVVLYLPWIQVILTEQAGILGGGITGAPGTLTPAALLPILQILLSEQMAIPLAGFGLGVLFLLRRPTWAGVSVLIGGAGLLLALVLLSTRFDLLSARTLVFVTPLLLVVCGYGFSRVDWRLGAGLAGVWLVATLAFPQVIQPRLDTGAAARALAAAFQPGDAVILEAGWDDNAFAYEIGQVLPDGAEIVRTQPWTNERTGGGPVVPEIAPVLQTHARVWVVQWLQAPQVLPHLEGGGDGYHLVQTLDISAGEYGARFNAPTIHIRLFVRPVGTDMPQLRVSSG